MSSVLGFLLEKGKHTFYRKGFEEQYRQGTQTGKSEFSFAALLQMFTLFASVIGIVWFVNDLKGVDKQQQKKEITADYEAKIQSKQGEINAQDSTVKQIFERVSYKGKINQLSEGAKTYNDASVLLSTLVKDKSKLENELSSILSENNLNLVSYSKSALKENKIYAFGFGFLQFAIEFLLFVFLRKVCNIEYKMALEFQTDTQTVNVKTKQPQRTQAKTETTSKTETEPKTKNVSRETYKDFKDWKSVTNSLRMNLKRYYQTGYTKSRFDTIEKNIKELAKYGYEVKLNTNTFEMPKKLNRTLPQNSKVEVSYNGKKIIINYL